MSEPKKTWKRILTEGALAPLGTPAEHLKSFFKNNFSKEGSLLDRFLGNSFISSLTAVGGVGGGIFTGVKIGGLAGFGIGAAAIVPSYIAAGAACLGVIAAGAAVTGAVHGVFKVLRNVFEHENLIYGPEPKPLIIKILPREEPATKNGSPQPDFSLAAKPATESNIQKLDKILGEHKKRPTQN